MAKSIGHSANYTSRRSPAEIRERTLAWFTQYAGSSTIVADTPQELELKNGSQAKMRLLGGAFIAAKSLPVRTLVTMAPAGTETTVTVSANDAVGLGSKTGMKGKYEEWLVKIVDGIRAETGG